MTDLAYVSLDELKSEIMGINGTSKDDRLDALRLRASRAVDQICRRRFYTLDESEARYYSPRVANRLWIDDFLSITEVATDLDGDRVYETVWDSTDFDPGPYNARNEFAPEPYGFIEPRPFSAKWFPQFPRSTRITTTEWGYCAIADVPGNVVEATIRLAGRLFKLSDAPLGIQSGGDFALRIARQDPEIMNLLGNFILVAAG